MNGIKELIEWILKIFKFWVIIQPWEQAVIVRNGKTQKVVNGGIYFKIPYIDSVYVQEIRQRMSETNIQSLVTSDNKNIIIDGGVTYSIRDIGKLYNSMTKVEMTILNNCMAIMAKYVQGKSFAEINLNDLENEVITQLRQYDSGIEFISFKVMNYTHLRAFRIIQDNQFTRNGINLDTKR